MRTPEALLDYRDKRTAHERTMKALRLDPTSRSLRAKLAHLAAVCNAAAGRCGFKRTFASALPKPKPLTPGQRAERMKRGRAHTLARAERLRNDPISLRELRKANAALMAKRLAKLKG